MAVTVALGVMVAVAVGVFVEVAVGSGVEVCETSAVGVEPPSGSGVEALVAADPLSAVPTVCAAQPENRISKTHRRESRRRMPGIVRGFIPSYSLPGEAVDTRPGGP